jgi:hypothetical protein
VAKLKGSNGTLVWVHDIAATTSGAGYLSTKPGRPVVLSSVFTGMLTYPQAPSGNVTKTGDTTKNSALIMPLDRTSGRALWARTFLSSVSLYPSVDADIRAATGDVEVALLISGTVTSDTGSVTTVSDVSAVLATLNATTGAHSAVASYLTTYGFDIRVRTLPGGGVVVAGENSGATTINGGTTGHPSQDVWIMGTTATHGQAWSRWITGLYAGQTQDRREFLSCMDVDHWGRIVVGVETASNGCAIDGVAIVGSRTVDATTDYMALVKLAEGGSTIWAKGVNAGTTASVTPLHCRFALNGETLFSASVSPNGTPDFGGGAIAANARTSAAVVKWSP